MGTEIGVEIEEGVFVEAEDPNVTAVEAENIDATKEENDITDENVKFDCPGGGLHPSPTNCADYYQCTEGNDVRYSITNFLF